MAYNHLSVPDMSGYKIKYYFSNSVEEESPRYWTPHIHDALELYVLIEGDVSFAVESSHYKLTPGDAIITKPNEIHNCILNSRSVHRHLCFWFDISSDFIFGDFVSHDYGSGNLISPDEKDKTKLLELYYSIIEAHENEDTYREFYLSLEILGILRSHLNKGEKGPDYPPLMKDILLDIAENISSIDSLEYLSSKFYLSQSTLFRMFKTHLNTTPKNYIETRKLAYSRKLLKDGSSVREAALASGFTNVSNFIRLFKKRFGTTPRAYKVSK